MKAGGHGAAGGQDGAATGDGGSPGGERQIPFFCPYCGEEDLVPAGAASGSWSCRACARSFTLRFAGLRTGGAV